jgi:hypothetical protein
MQNCSILHLWRRVWLKTIGQLSCLPYFAPFGSQILSLVLPSIPASLVHGEAPVTVYKPINKIVTLWYFNTAIENCHVYLNYSLNMLTFHSYVTRGYIPHKFQTWTKDIQGQHDAFGGAPGPAGASTPLVLTVGQTPKARVQLLDLENSWFH